MRVLSLIALGASLVRALPLESRAGVTYYDPTVGGGSWLDNAGSGGEPLNVSSSSPFYMQLLHPTNIGRCLGTQLSRCSYRQRNPQLRACHRLVRIIILLLL